MMFRMLNLYHTKLWLIVLCCFSSTAFCLQDYYFTVIEPELIIYPQTEPNKNKKRSRLSVLTDEISNSSQFEIYEYIKIILTEMISIYEEEAERAREIAALAGDKDKQNKLYRWSNNTLNYAYQLIDVYNGMDEYSDLQVYTDYNHDSYLLIDNYPVVVASPVLNEPNTLEERIIVSVCDRMYCDMERLDQLAEDRKKRIKIKAGWKVFEGQYVYYTGSGLQFVFSDVNNKKLKQKMCLKIALDLTLIVQTLSEIIKKGVFVDWGYIYLQEKAGSHLHELVINPFGDKILLPIKAIQYLNDFPETALPWIKERLTKARKEFYFHNADQYLKAIYLK